MVGNHLDILAVYIASSIPPEIITQSIFINTTEFSNGPTQDFPYNFPSPFSDRNVPVNFYALSAGSVSGQPRIETTKRFSTRDMIMYVRPAKTHLTARSR